MSLASRTDGGSMSPSLAKSAQCLGTNTMKNAQSGYGIVKCYSFVVVLAVGFGCEYYAYCAQELVLS